MGGFGSSSLTASSNATSRTTNGFVIEDDALIKYEGHDKRVVVPDGVTRIDDDVFSGMDFIETIVLPDSMRTIGSSAFRHCDSLKSINLPEGLSEIEYDAFTYCESLTSIDIPSTVQSIGGDAFCFCNSIKQIKIPAALTDIGDDAFMFCDDLETVIVFGGARNSSALTRMKKHFREDVRIIWDGNDQSKPKSGSTTKKASGKSKKANTSGMFDERVSFNLPKGYEFVDETDDDGNRSVQIKVNPSVDDDGDTVYENTFMVNIQTPEGTSSRKSALDIIYEKNVDAVVNKRLGSKPEALMTISSSTSSILGVEFSISLINLGIALSNTEVLALTCIKPKVGDDADALQTALNQMKTIWNSVTLNGKKAITVDMGIESLLSAVEEKADADKEVGQSPIDNHVCQVGTYIEIGNRWRMELPYGMRYRFKTRGEDERFDELELDLDRRNIGHCFLGSTVKEQQEASHAILLMLSIGDNNFHEAFTVSLRNDDYMEVKFGLRIDGSGDGKTAYKPMISRFFCRPLRLG